MTYRNVQVIETKPDIFRVTCLETGAVTYVIRTSEYKWEVWK